MLGAIKLRYGFNQLEAVPDDGKWQVIGAINPKDKKKSEANTPEGPGPTEETPQGQSAADQADPLRARYGAARDSHPEEFAQAMARLRAAGVEVVERPGAMAYGPAPSPGEPGRMILDPNSSIGALRHEMRHFADDQTAGFPGMRHWMEDPNVQWGAEYRAYMEEIRFARSQRDFENARRLLDNARAEKNALLGLEERE